MKTQDIIQKQDEFIAELKKQLNVKWFAPNSMLRKLEADLSSLKSMRDEKEEKPAMTAEEYLKEYFKKKGADLDILRVSERRFVHYAIEAMKEYADISQSSPQSQPRRGAEDILDYLEGNMEPFDIPSYIYSNDPDRSDDNLQNQNKYIREDIVLKAMEEYRTQSEGKDMYSSEHWFNFIAWCFDEKWSKYKGLDWWVRNDKKVPPKNPPLTMDELHNQYLSLVK